MVRPHGYFVVLEVTDGMKISWPVIRFTITVAISALLLTELAATMAQEAILSTSELLYQGGVVQARDATTCNVNGISIL
jgi:hypothetical protein